MVETYKIVRRVTGSVEDDDFGIVLVSETNEAITSIEFVLLQVHPSFITAPLVPSISKAMRYSTCSTSFKITHTIVRLNMLT